MYLCYHFVQLISLTHYLLFLDFSQTSSELCLFNPLSLYPLFLQIEKEYEDQALCNTQQLDVY